MHSVLLERLLMVLFSGNVLVNLDTLVTDTTVQVGYPVCSVVDCGGEP